MLLAIFFFFRRTPAAAAAATAVVLAGASPSDGRHQHGSVLRNLLQGILQQILFADPQIQETRNRIDAGTAATTVGIVFVFSRNDPSALQQQQ